MKSWKGWAIALILSSASTAGIGQPSTVDDLVTRALAARTAGDYTTAVRMLRDASAASPEKVELQLLLTETLAWSKDFSAAETAYRQILDRRPDSREARLGLGRVLLWQKRYPEASREFGVLLSRNRNDTDALEGKATAAYWSGDYRTAAREFRRVLQLDPKRQLAEKSLREIEETARPWQRIDIDAVDDDQPYTTLRGEITASVASDPLTRWWGSAGGYRLHSGIYGGASAPFAGLGGEAVLPNVRLTLGAWGELMRYPDGIVRPNGAITIRRQVARSVTISARAEKKELLATATAVQSHPSVSTIAMTINRESAGGWTGAAEIASLRYFDGNHGVAAWTYGLAPLVSHEKIRLFAGLSATYRDSDDSRFYYAAASSVRNGSGYDYNYRGEYRPYWAPVRLREFRAIGVAETTAGKATIKLHLDGGTGRDRAIGFSPASGFDPLPPAVYPFTFDRTFHPALIQLSTSIPLVHGYTAEAAFEISRTAYYRAKSLHASLVRRR